MLHANTMTDNCPNLFCLVDGEATSNVFSIMIPSSDTVHDLKKAIKVQKAVAFADVDADTLTLWRISIPDEDDDEQPILLDIASERKKLKATSKLCKFFDTDDPRQVILPRFAFIETLFMSLFVVPTYSSLPMHCHSPCTCPCPHPYPSQVTFRINLVLALHSLVSAIIVFLFALLFQGHSIFSISFCVLFFPAIKAPRSDQHVPAQQDDTSLDHPSVEYCHGIQKTVLCQLPLQTSLKHLRVNLAPWRGWEMPPVQRYSLEMTLASGLGQLAALKSSNT